MKIILIALCMFSMPLFAATADYTEISTSLSVFEYKLDRFNETHRHHYDKYRELDSKNNERIKALSYVNYVQVKKGKEPMKLILCIQLTPFFHSIDIDNKQRAKFSEIIIEDTLEELKSEISQEISKEHLFGVFEWMAFSNTVRKAYDVSVKIEKGVVVDVKVNTRDYYDFEIKKELINLHGHVMIQVQYKSNTN